MPMSNVLPLFHQSAATTADKGENAISSKCLETQVISKDNFWIRCKTLVGTREHWESHSVGEMWKG